MNFEFHEVYKDPVTKRTSKHVWVKGYEGLYSVNSEGKVFTHKELMFNDRKGYNAVTFLGKKVSVHRLVAKTFIPNPDNLPQINHKNGNKKDNRVENLEWCTAKYNRSHADKTGLRKHTNIGERAGGVRFTESQIRDMRSLYKRGNSRTSIAVLYDTTPSYISDIILRKVWKHLK